MNGRCDSYICRRNHFFPAKLCFALLVMAGSNSTQGATVNWTNIAGGNWSVAANWSPNQVPGPSDDVFVTASGTFLVTQDIYATINSLTLGGASGQQTITNNTEWLILNNDSIIQSNGTYDFNGNGDSGIGGGGGNLTVQGTFNWDGGQLYPGTSLIVATNGVLNIEGPTTFWVYSALTNQGTVNWQGADIVVDRNAGFGGYSGTAVIWNEPEASWNVQCDQTIQNGSGSDQFYNAGFFQKSLTAA